MEEMEKQCQKCSFIKPFEEFYRLSSSKDGYSKWCKQCQKSYYIENKEKIKKRTKTWRQHRKEQEKTEPNEKICPICEEVRDINDFCKKNERKDGRNYKCKSCVVEEHKEYYEKNKEAILIKNEKWKENNLERYRELRRNWHSNKRKTDPCYKLRENIGRAIRDTLKNQKNRSILSVLPYSLEELKFHLESLFSPEMSWDNYGTLWEIDHIYPQSLLPFISFEDENFLKCWSLANLQPLTIRENRRKSNKIIE